MAREEFKYALKAVKDYSSFKFIHSGPLVEEESRDIKSWQKKYGNRALTCTTCGAKLKKEFSTP